MKTYSSKMVRTGLLALTLAGAAAFTSELAEAHNNFVRGLGAGLAGAAIGGAIAAGLRGSSHSPPYEAYASEFAPLPVVAPAPYYRPQCHVVWEQNRWGDMYRTQVCD